MRGNFRPPTKDAIDIVKKLLEAKKKVCLHVVDSDPDGMNFDLVRSMWRRVFCVDMDMGRVRIIKDGSEPYVGHCVPWADPPATKWLGMGRSFWSNDIPMTMLLAAGPSTPEDASSGAAD